MPHLQLPPNTKIRVDGFLYDMIPNQIIKEGDLVLDTRDNAYGYCDFVHGDRISIKQDWVVEGFVPMSRVMKLVFSLANYSLT